MATEYEVGQRIKVDEAAVSLAPGTPAATLEYQWAFIAGDPDGITMSETDAAANLVSGETAVAYAPSAEGAVRGAVKAENAGGADVVWYPQANFRTYPNVYTVDFSEYADTAALRAAWPRTEGTRDDIVLTSSSFSDNNLAAKSASTSTSRTFFRWDEVSNRPNNGNFKLYAELYSDRGSDVGSPREIAIQARDRTVGVTYDANAMPSFNYYSITWDLQDGTLRHKIWKKGDPEPADAEATSKDVPVGSGAIGIEMMLPGQRFIGFVSIAFNGADPDRPV